MFLLRLPGRLRYTALSVVHRRGFQLPRSGPIVSFTFDDFPQSALHVGGAILLDHQIRGTFYACIGLMNQVNALGRHFSEADLERLLHEGHELANHTFSHLSCRRSPLRDFEADVLRGRQALEDHGWGHSSRHFSYPYGHISLRAKERIGRMMSTCRGSAPGINESPADLNCLRANSIYSGTFNSDSLDRLLALNGEKRGWLIFYTHDVSNRPSPYGCTPKEFETVVKLFANSGSTILPVGQVVRDAVAGH